MFIQKYVGSNDLEDISVLLISGVHGNELTPNECINLFINKYFTGKEKIKNIKNITTVQEANEPAHRTHSREFQPYSHSNNLNRIIYNSNEYSSVSDSAESLKGLIDKHDVTIDIHSSPKIFECVYAELNKYTGRYIEWCNKSNVKISFCSQAILGSSDRYAIERGKIGITIELNKLDEIDKLSAEVGSNMIVNLLKNINCIYMKPEIKIDRRKVQPCIDVFSPQKGFISPKTNLGDSVKIGQEIAIINDCTGEKLESIYSPVNGWILSLPDWGYLDYGDCAFQIQPHIEKDWRKK